MERSFEKNGCPTLVCIDLCNKVWRPEKYVWFQLNMSINELDLPCTQVKCDLGWSWS